MTSWFWVHVIFYTHSVDPRTAQILHDMNLTRCRKPSWCMSTWSHHADLLQICQFVCEENERGRERDEKMDPSSSLPCFWAVESIKHIRPCALTQIWGYICRENQKQANMMTLTGSFTHSIPAAAYTPHTVHPHSLKFCHFNIENHGQTLKLWLDPFAWLNQTNKKNSRVLKNNCRPTFCIFLI